MRGLQTWANKENGFFVVRLHYTADPIKRGKKWQEAVKRGMTEEAWQQEFEINPEQTKGKKVFPEFVEQVHVADLQPVEGLPLFRGWDFGFHHPCCTFSQLNNDDQWCMLWELMGNDEALENFVPKVKSIYPNFKYLDYCDRAGAQSSDKAQRTSVQILNSFGIFPQYKFSNPEDRAALIRGRFLKRLDGKPGILINKNCRITIAGANGGYHYPETTVRSPAEKEEPVKDGIHDHVWDCWGYTAIFKFNVIKKKVHRMMNHQYIRYNPFTGIRMR